jgi:hypothetical protein
MTVKVKIIYNLFNPSTHKNTVNFSTALKSKMLIRVNISDR